MIQQLRRTCRRAYLGRDVLRCAWRPTTRRSWRALPERRLVWVGSGGADPRRRRIRFLFRGEGSTFLEAPPADLSFLGGARSMSTPFSRARRSPAECAPAPAWPKPRSTALLELVMAGLVTNGALAVRQLVVWRAVRRQSRVRPLSSLEAELAERLGSRQRAPWRRAPAQPQRLPAAKRRVRQQLEQNAARGADRGAGAPVHRFGVLGKALPPPSRWRCRRGSCWHATASSPASLDDEFGAWSWPLLYAELQRLEMRGEVRRGFFVQGLAGVQFACRRWWNS